MGIELKPEDLKPNPGLRYISKLCLNSLWGKFGQDAKPQHKCYINEPKEYYKLLTNKNIVITDRKFLDVKKVQLQARQNEAGQVLFTPDTVVYITYNDKQHSIPLSNKTNIYTACFTTANARLRLYDMLYKLGENVLYCDTDSVVYEDNDYTKSVVTPHLGDSLGQWTDELEGKSIDFFVSMAPKDYSYTLNDGSHKGKCKGFRTTEESEEKMTIESRVKLITGELDNIEISFDQFKIKQGTITTTPITKQWKFNYDKRVVKKINDNLIDTLPYGY